MANCMLNNMGAAGTLKWIKNGGVTGYWFRPQ